MNKFVVPTSLIIKSTACLISFFFTNSPLKIDFCTKMFFFLLHLLQVQQHMMRVRGDDDDDGDYDA